MRQWVRAAILVVLGVVSTALLGVVTAIMAAVSLAATALIVPGTGTPDAQDKPLYMGHAIERYVTPFVGSDCTVANCNPTSAEYPASFFPLVIFPGWCEPGRCETWNTSVEEGVESLTGLVDVTQDEQGLVLFGYSQGGAVVSDALRELAANNPTLLDKVLKVVLIGNVYNPDGGLFTRLGFLPTIPFLDITFGPKTPVDMFDEDGKFTSIGFEYDPVMYAPLYWGNPLAMFNALAAFETVHGYYLTPNENGMTDPIAYGYTPQEIEDIYEPGCAASPHCRLDEYNNEYWMLPARSLPMFDLLMSVVPAPLKPLVQPLVNLLTPAAKVLIDLGYDWSGDPAQQRYLSILPFNPFTNWVQVGFDLVAAVQEGIQNAFGGGTTLVVPADEPDVLALSAQAGEPGQVEPIPAQDQQGQPEQQAAEQLADVAPSDDAQPAGLPEGQDEKVDEGAGEDGALGEEDGVEGSQDEGPQDEDPKQDPKDEDGAETVGTGSDPAVTKPETDRTDGNKVTPGGHESDGTDGGDAGDERGAETDSDAGSDTPAAA